MTESKEKTIPKIALSDNNDDLEKLHNDNATKSIGMSVTLGLAFKTLGVIFGDIGTSPLYTYNSIIKEPPEDENDVIGVASLIIWSLTIVPMIKYVFLVLRADDNSMGGTFALYSLICRHTGLSIREGQTSDDLNVMNYDTRSIHSSKEVPNLLSKNKLLQKILLVVVLLAASLIMSDGLLTPAISVISAVEGMSVPIPSLANAVLPISCAIIVLLFFAQSVGTNKVGMLFSPIVSLWFLSLATIGIWNISQYPAILKAFNPQYAIEYFVRNGSTGYDNLGGVLLAITGVEALYADLGHFTRASIQISFPCFVYPPLVLAYLGQGARLIKDPNLINGYLFWLTTPENPGIYWIVFVLATLATIIASQAMISATFSLVHQAMQLDCFPRVKVIHTSKTVRGQIYIPEINYMLMVATVLVCVGFQHSANLTNAYGVAVITVVFITTILFSIVIHVVWNFSIFISIAFFLVFGLVDLSFLGATFLKIADGGWFTLIYGVLLCALMLLWKWGTTLRLDYELNNKSGLDNIFSAEKDGDNGNVGSYKEEISVENSSKRRKNKDLLRLKYNEYPIVRLPGIALFYNDVTTKVPITFGHFIKHFPSLPEILIFMTIRPLAIPFVSEDDRLVVQKINKYEGFYRVIARYGYMDKISQDKNFVMRIVEAIRRDSDRDDNDDNELGDDVNSVNHDVTTYVVPTQKFDPKPNSNWLRRASLECYVFLMNNSRQSYSNWNIPIEDVIDVGMKIAV